MLQVTISSHRRVILKMDARKVIREHDSDQGNRRNRDCRFILSFDVKALVPSPFLHQIIIHCVDNL